MARDVLEPLRENGLSYNVPVASVFPMTDESDRKFYDVAKTAEAFLVTGNMKHYPKEPFIVTPSEFANTFKYRLPSPSWEVVR
jgi:predicted nucleic acid-binding protein